MKRLLSLFGLILIAAVGTLILIPYIVSPQTMREAVAAQLENWTGRKVAVSGQASLSMFPSLTVRLDGVSVANADGMKPEPFIAMDELDASLRLISLLRGEVEIERFMLVRPRFNFMIDEEGRANWRLAGAASSNGAASSSNGAASATEATDSGRAEAGRSSPPAAKTPRIGTFLILDGQIKYRDLRKDTAFEASSVNATLTWPSPRSAMTSAGNLVWRGEVLNFKVSSDDPAALIAGGTSRTAIMVDSSRFTVDVKGQASTTVDFALDGQINLRVPSVRALARWFGTEIPNGGGLNSLSLASKFLVGGTKLSFSEAVFGLDGNSAEGAIVVKLEGSRPQIQATLATVTLNLNPYFPANAPAGAAAAAENSGSGWSDEAVDLSALRLTNADLRLSAGKITARNYDLGAGAITAALKDGRFTGQIAELRAYGGQINASVTIDDSDEAPAIATSFNAQGVNLLPFLTDMAQFPYLEGKGDVSGKLEASGSTTRELVGSLSGNLAVSAANGVIKGIDLAGLVQALHGKPLEGWLAAVGKDTKVDTLKTQFYIDRGIARNEELLLKGPAVDISGSGRIDLPARLVDYRISAALLDLPGSGNNGPGSSLKLPLIVRGPWDSPDIYLDPVKLNVGPEAEKIIQSIKDAVDEKDVERIERAAREGGIKGVLDLLTGPKTQ